MSYGYVNYYDYLTQEELEEEYKNYETTKEVKSEIGSLMDDLKYAINESNGFGVSYGDDIKDFCSLNEYMTNIGVRLDYLNKKYEELRILEVKTDHEINEEYYKMMIFQYEFTNGFEYTEEELKYYRKRFYDYYEFKGERK